MPRPLTSTTARIIACVKTLTRFRESPRQSTIKRINRQIYPSSENSRQARLNDKENQICISSEIFQENDYDSEHRGLTNHPDAAQDPGVMGSQKMPPPNFKSVAPVPGFCLKTKTDKEEKVFINICQGDNLPKPKDITDEELKKLLDSEDPSGFRVPLSIGEPHVEADKGGSGCTCYDIIIHSDFFRTIMEREQMMGFFLSVVLEGIESKYDIALDRNWKVLRNKKFFGSVADQNVRASSKPLIQDMDGAPVLSKKQLISEIDSPSMKEAPKIRIPEPPYTIIQEPAEGHPDFMVAEVHLPKVKSAASVTLDIGEDRILLETRSNVYRLDIYLPFDIVQDDVTAQYNRQTKILTITIPVVPKS